MSELLTELEASLFTSLTCSALRQRRWLRQPPTYLKIGRLVRYRRADLEAFLESCRVEPQGAGHAE